MGNAFAAEVTRLHDFFQSWFNGDDVLLEEFADALAGDFVIISPDGNESTRKEIVEIVDRSRDSGHVDISIVAPRVIVGGDMTVGTYEEHQVREGRATRRISTAVLSVEPSAPGGWLWHLVHETWLPDEAPDQA